MPLPRLLIIVSLIALCFVMTVTAIWARGSEDLDRQRAALPCVLYAAGAGLLAAGYLVFAPLTWAGLLIGCAGVALSLTRRA